MKFQATFLTLIASALASPAPKALDLAARSTLSARAYGGPPSTGEVCPQAQDLWYLSTNNFYYQIACSVDTAGDAAIAVYAGTQNVLDCAQHCDTWNAIAATSPKCFSATFYEVPPNGVDNCVLRPGEPGWYAFAPASNAETAVLGPAA